MRVLVGELREGDIILDNDKEWTVKSIDNNIVMYYIIFEIYRNQEVTDRKAEFVNKNQTYMRVE